MDLIIEDLLCNVKEYLQNLTENDRFFALKNHTHTKSEVTDFTHNNTSHSEEYTTKNYVDTQLGTKIGKNEQIAIDKVTDLRSTLNDKSSVSFARTLDSGTKIGKITINGTGTDIFCETNTDTIYSHPSTHNTDIIIDSNRHNNIGSERNATQSTINTQIDTKIGNKVDKISGKGLSTNDYTTVEKNKLEGISSEANKYIHPSYNSINEDLYKITTENGHIKTATKITKTDITNLGIPENDTTYNNATILESGLMSKEDKERLDNLSIYEIFLTDIESTTPSTTSLLEVRRGASIWACVRKDGDIIKDGTITFIANNVTYDRVINEETGLAKLNINLGQWTWNAYEQKFEEARYGIFAVYRKNGWTKAIDIKTMRVTEQ